MRYFFLLLALGMVGCADESKAKRILEEQGYRNIEITGYEFFGCSEDDMFHTGFVATNQNGKRINGVVCSDWIKSATVRFK